MALASRLLLVLCLAIPVFAAPTARELVEKHRNLTVGEGMTVSALKVSVGHMTVVLDQGTVAPVMAGDSQVGLFLAGSGTFTYETVNKDELTALRYNAKHADLAVQPTTDKATITERFKSVLLRGNGLPEVTGAAAAAPAAQFTESRALFTRMAGSDPDEYLFVLQALNAPGARVVRADVQGNDRPYVYVYDDVWTHDESLALLRRPQYRVNKDADWLYFTPLSKQAIGRDNRKAAPPNVKLTDLDVTLVNTGGPDASLTIVETLVPQGRPASALKFDQYRDYYFDINREPRRYNVRSITDDKGNKLAYHHDRDTLLVGLAQPVPAGAPVKLKFEIDGNILYRPDGSNFWELGIEPWYPRLRSNEMEFTYHGIAKVKKPFVVFMSGKTVRREEEGDWNVVESKLDELRVNDVAILAGKYQYDEETKNGLTVRVASFIVKNQQAYKSLRSIGFAAAELYPRFLGPFPFNEITIIERNEVGWGQAPAGIVFITKEAFTPMHDDANFAVEGINRRVAHEIAHMYWGHAVKSESPEEQWIEEAFSEYSAALFMKDAGRPGDYTKAFVNWKADAKDATKISIIPMANRLLNEGDRIDSILARRNLIYAKGAVLLAALHKELGDEQFLTFLKSYQRSFKGKYGNTALVMGLLQFLTKKDYAPFFEQYFYGTAMPDVKPIK